MLDIQFIRDHLEAVRRAAADKRMNCDLDRLCAVDDQRRAIQRELDELRAKSNEVSPRMALYRNPRSEWYRQAVERGTSPQQITALAEQTQGELAEIKTRIKVLEDETRPILDEFDALMLTVPQPPDPDVPPGKDESENVELRRVGEPPRFTFTPKDHVALGAALDIIDLERGVRLAGTRNYVLKGDGALLHQAVLRLAQQMMVERGFVPMTVPVLVREEVMQGTGYFPLGRDQAYLCERDGKSLVGTAEVPLTAYYQGEILEERDLPKKLVATSLCFRREAGAAGKDTTGLYRIHLFEKVEQVILCRNDLEASKQFHRQIVQNAEDVLAKLELPYRVVNVCTGDLGQGQVQKFDIETWMPSRNAYGETHSASRFYEFQARRLKLRYRDRLTKKLHFCHTLNNTVIASPRILIPLLEVHQQADGGVTIPEALRLFMGGKDRIEPIQVPRAVINQD